MKIKREVTRQPRVEMLPLIDIVFLLLIFFIYAMLSMAVHRGLNLDLPESTSAEVSSEDRLSISVKHLGGSDTGLLILVNEDRVELESLSGKLKAMTNDLKERKAFVFAEETISYQELFQVLDQVKGAGIIEISLQANKAED